MPDPESRFQQLIAKLKARDYRLTPQRAALRRLIASSEGHPSASHLYDQLKTQFPTTSLATVYKTLNLHKKLGEVLELGFANDDNRYDGSRPRQTLTYSKVVIVQPVNSSGPAPAST